MKKTIKMMEERNAAMMVENFKLTDHINILERAVKSDLKIMTYVSLDKLARAMTDITGMALRLVELSIQRGR